LRDSNGFISGYRGDASFYCPIKFFYGVLSSGAAHTTAGDNDLTRPVEGAVVSHREIVPASASGYY